MLDSIGVMKGIGGKMNWLNQRHVVISNNIANSDTPKFRPSDLQEVDFSSVMGATQNRPQIQKMTTDSAHIGGNRQVGDADAKKSSDTYEVAPAENSVVMEEQLFKAQETMADYNMITNLYRKNVGMIRMVVSE